MLLSGAVPSAISSIEKVLLSELHSPSLAVRAVFMQWSHPRHGANVFQDRFKLSNGPESALFSVLLLLL